MPATVTYLSVAPSTAIPIRVFVNRKKVLSSNPVAINDKSIINLSTVGSISLSNFDLTNLIMDIQEKLKRVLLFEPLEELFFDRSVSRVSKLVREISNTWKCKLVVSLGYVADLRYKLSCLQTPGDFRFLTEHNIEVDLRDSHSSALLVRTLNFDFEPSESTSENNDPTNVMDSKKNISYKLQKQRLIQNRVGQSLALYVLHRPRN